MSARRSMSLAMTCSGAMYASLPLISPVSVGTVQLAVRLGDAEVGDLDVAVRGDENVLRRHVAVDHAELVPSLSSSSCAACRAGGHVRDDARRDRRAPCARRAACRSPAEARRRRTIPSPGREYRSCSPNSCTPHTLGWRTSNAMRASSMNRWRSSGACLLAADRRLHGHQPLQHRADVARGPDAAHAALADGRKQLIAAQDVTRSGTTSRRGSD